MRTSRMLAVALVLAAPLAHAETKAWTAAKKIVPAGSQMVGGLNIAAARASQLYQQVLPMLMSQAGAAKDQLDAIKKQCGIDALDVVDSIAGGLDGDGKGAFVIALKGTTRKDLEACLQKRATAGGRTFATRTDAGLTVYSNVDAAGDVYVKWLAADVLAISTSPDDKAATTKLFGGGIANDKTMKSRLASIDTNAVVWGSVSKTQQLDEHTTMSAAYGSIDLAHGNVDAKMHIVVSSAKEATTFVAGIIAKLAEARASKPPPSGALADVLKSVTVKAAGNEAVATATFPEQDVFELVGMVAGGLGH